RMHIIASIDRAAAADTAGAQRVIESISPLFVCRGGFFIPRSAGRRFAAGRTPGDRELCLAMRTPPARREGVERMATPVRAALPPYARRVDPRARRTLDRCHLLRPLNVDRPTRQSSRNVEAGSTRANRAPGIHDASPAAARSAMTTATKVNASVGATPNNSFANERVAASAATTPIAAPVAPSVSP